MQPAQQRCAAAVLSCCYKHRQQQQSSSHIMQQVPCTRYQVSLSGWWKKSFARVPSFFRYCTPGITYMYKKSKTAPGTRYYQRAFKPLFLIESIQIYIILVGSTLFCAEAFFTLSATTKTFQVQHILRIIPDMTAASQQLVNIIKATF